MTVVIKKVAVRKPSRATQKFNEGIDMTLTDHHFPTEYWLRIRSSNPLERILQQARRILRHRINSSAETPKTGAGVQYERFAGGLAANPYHIYADI